jgi:uncharacterized protein involved in exopolysaccharide biosynthesis
MPIKLYVIEHNTVSKLTIKAMDEKKKIININAIELIRLLIADKKKMLVYSCVAGVIGVIIAFGTPKVYESTVVLAPEESGNSFSGSISSLASMVGMDMKIGQTGDAIYPEIYPDLMGSTGFIVGLFPITVTKEKTGETYSYMDYLQNHQKMAISDYPFALISTIIKKMSEDDQPDSGHQINPRHLTKKEDEIVKAIKGNINCSVDKKTNVITITVKDQDPFIAATVADSVQLHLQHAITDYRTRKARTDLEFMQQLFDEAKEEYNTARRAYASFCDANINVSLQSVRSKIDDLENEMQLKYNIYQQVVEQLQLAKAKVQERTPAFTIIQDATVPLKHSNRSKIASLVIWMIFGFMLRCGMLFWKNRKQFVRLGD